VNLAVSLISSNPTTGKRVVWYRTGLVVTPVSGGENNRSDMTVRKKGRDKKEDDDMKGA